MGPKFCCFSQKGKRCAHKDVHYSFIHKRCKSGDNVSMSGRWQTGGGWGWGGQTTVSHSVTRPWQWGRHPPAQPGVACSCGPRGRPLISRTRGLHFTGCFSACSSTHTLTRSSVQQTLTENRQVPGLEDQSHLPIPQRPSPTASLQAGRCRDRAAHAGGPQEGFGPAAGKLLCSDTSPPPLSCKKNKTKTSRSRVLQKRMDNSSGP